MSETKEEHSSETSTRKIKLKELRLSGWDYPNSFSPSHELKKIINNPVIDEEVSVAGRIMLKRLMGKASFVSIQDDGTKIQLYIAQDNIGIDNYEFFKNLDLGDIIAIGGKVFYTKKLELSIKVFELELLSKCLHPIADKYHGIQDTELRYRKRYLDLITNTESRSMFIKRSKIISGLREIMEDYGFLEIETPMLHAIPGGANARPFITHHNALDLDLFLRIAPELYLKKMIVAGVNKIFEINRNFRNEGISPKHNPEFTMMEFYAAYMNNNSLIDLSIAIIQKMVRKLYTDLIVEYQGNKLDFNVFHKYDFPGIIQAYLKIDANTSNTLEGLKQVLSSKGIIFNSNISLGEAQLLLFEECIESNIIQPTIIFNYPIEISPLSRASNANKSIAERFEIFIAGREVANGFSELNDPEDQARRFKAQAYKKNTGDDEAMYYDDTYVEALEYGMPHVAGCGIGIDRLVMLLTNAKNIKDIILFPQLKPVNIS